MNAPTESAPARLTQPIRLRQLGALLVAGPDAHSFLQGQLSAHMQDLQPARVLPSSCNSPQGRVQAVVWLVQRTDGVALILPAETLDAVALRLRRYLLRAKVTIENVGERLAVGVVNGAAGAAAAHTERDGLSFITLPGHSQQLVLGAAAGWRESDPKAELAWRLEHIRAGLPQVYSPTYETFVAQMLNLDLLDAISFNKGCYTGQEIIARTHYRGAVKRRMFRFSAACPPPPPGARILAGEQHAGDVVDAAPTDEGCELLAVISLARLGDRLETETAPGVALERQSLPYDVPVA